MLKAHALSGMGDAMIVESIRTPSVLLLSYFASYSYLRCSFLKMLLNYYNFENSGSTDRQKFIIKTNKRKRAAAREKITSFLDSISGVKPQAWRHLSGYTHISTSLQTRYALLHGITKKKTIKRQRGNEELSHYES